MSTYQPQPGVLTEPSRSHEYGGVLSVSQRDTIT
jgi:hypothetical protein